MKRKNAISIPVTAFTLKGKRVRKFKSITQFLKYAKSRDKLDSARLKVIRNNKLAMAGGHLLGLSERFCDMHVNPLLCHALYKKARALKRRNLSTLQKFNSDHQLIVMVDSCLQILGYSWGTIKQLSQSEKVSTGTIKSSLHRSAKGFSNEEKGYAKYYIWLTDLPAFIANAKKAICSK